MSNSLYLAALAVAAIDGLEAVSTRPPFVNTDDYVSGGVLDAHGRHWMVKCPKNSHAATIIEAEAALAPNLLQELRRGNLPFDILRPAGFVHAATGGRAVVCPQPFGTAIDWEDIGRDQAREIGRVIASIRDMTELETLQRKLTDLEMETLAYKARLENLETEMDAGFVGHSAPMRRLRKEASKAARTEAITLILGETGTGKTLTAKAIHDMGQRSAEPFIAVNCGAIPMSLMESELFGYEKGAFTGAAKSGKPGMFELAHKGTLLLDEIGELPLPMQAKLLQVLDGHPFHRVGGTKPITVDVRVIAATNKPLADMAASGQFREDLFYRLRVLTVEIPPLRERPDDIPVLAMHFLQEIIKKSGLQKNFDPQVLNCFLTYRWPGNVRELRALVQSLATMSEEETITMQDLPQYMQAQSPLPQGSVSFRQPMREAVAELERNMIMTALTETGSTYKAARRLKVSQSTIVRKAQRYKIGLVEIAHK